MINKYTFLTALMVFAIISLLVAGMTVAYKLGMEKGRLDSRQSWSLAGQQSSLIVLADSLGYFVHQDDVNNKLTRVVPSNPKSKGVYLYEHNGMRTLVTECYSQACKQYTPPGYYD